MLPILHFMSTDMETCQKQRYHGSSWIPRRIIIYVVYVNNVTDNHNLIYSTINNYISK